MQFFSRFKRADQGDHTWSTRSVNGSRKVVVVSRLRPETIYQFAVLAENVLGSGKFSKTVTARTKGAFLFPLFCIACYLNLLYF